MKLPGTALLLVAFSLGGCFANQARFDQARQVNVFGIELYSDSDYREISGVTAREEPCLKGYERSFDPPDVTIGYGFDRRIRKITTRNPKTSLFGISPGMPAAEAEQRALQAGLQKVSSHRYQGNGISLFLLIDESGRLFGITLEAVE